MKKALCIMTALLMLTVSFALAEANAPVDDKIIERFSDTWVADGLALEIWAEDGAFHCRGTLGDGEIESDEDSWEYAACRYDAASESLQCADGTRTHEVYDTAAKEKKVESTATGLTAVVFFANGADKLIWNDSEGMTGNTALSRLKDAEAEDAAEAKRFVGRWGCGRATIDITDRGDDSYNVRITWGSSAAQSVEWAYDCVYDGAKKCLHTYAPGSKTTVTYAEGGDIESAVKEYDDGQASFTIDGDGMLIWDDAKENAGADMRFERGIAPGTQVNTLIVEGSFVVQIPVAEGNDGWQADDMSQDDSVVKLYDADIIEDTFVARYDPTGDGDMAVCVKHMNGIACDEAFTWDLRVKGGVVQEIIGGSHAQAPDEAELNPQIAGDWQIDDIVMAGMTIAKNEGRGWALEIRSAFPKARVFRANVCFDCERNALVFNDGIYYDFEIDNTPEGKVGEALASDVEGSLALTADEEGNIILAWYNALETDETARFHRPEGWDEEE